MLGTTLTALVPVATAAALPAFSGTWVEALSLVALLGGFLVAAAKDWATREVSDRLWQAMAVAGLVLGGVSAGSGGVVAFVLWVVVGLFVLQHLVPWDVAFERRSESLPGYLEIGMYAGVGLLLVVVGIFSGVGTASGVPVPVVAVFVTVLIARGLFELGVLYGGADAKALMVAGLVLPLFPTPLLSVPATASAILSLYPFSLTLLIDAALLAVTIPLYLALRNLISGEFEFPRGFVGYRIPVSELPRRFVWLRDPTFGAAAVADSEEADVDTAEEDQTMRERQARELAAAGVDRVWVTPQLPFVVLMAAGAFAAVLAGNLLFDLFAVV